MLNKLFLLVFLCALELLTLNNGLCQYSVSEDNGNSFYKAVDSIVIRAMNKAGIPGLALGIVRNDTIVLTKGYGVKNIDNGQPVSKQSVFHTASISKLFTAMAVMQMVKNGEISLDDHLVKLIPELDCTNEGCDKITIRSLLNHTSGLPDINNYNWSNNNQSETDLKDYITRLKIKLIHEPLSAFYYSNLAYDILGYLIEKVTEESFEDYVQQNLLLPAGMINSDFRYYKITDSLRTSPHTKNRLSGTIKIRKTYPYTREHAPSSTLNSSAYDLSKWMVTFLKGLEEDNWAYSQMLTPSFQEHPYIGLGFQLGELHGFGKAGHYGGDRGFRSYLMFLPEKQIGLVLLANCDYEEDFRQDILHAIAGLMTKSK